MVNPRAVLIGSIIGSVFGVTVGMLLPPPIRKASAQSASPQIVTGTVSPTAANLPCSSANYYQAYINTSIGQISMCNGTAWTDAIPTSLPQLTTGVITGTITVPATLVSAGSFVTTVNNASIQAGSFYLCSKNTTNAAAQTALNVAGNVMAAGAINIVTTNTSASTLLNGGYSVNFKCTPQ